jgi:hypothetical protein
MREQSFNKIRKTVFILLAVFLVISLTTTSASAWYSKTSEGKCKEVAKPVKEVVKPVKEVVTPVREVTKVNVVLGIVQGCCCDTGWFGGCWNNCWGNCWNNCWDDCWGC